MPTQVLMPQFGESVIEGTITKWLKSVGESVQEYEALVEVNTDKVDTEIASPASGVLLEILVPAGVTAQAGMLLAWIGTESESVSNLPAGSPTTQLTTISSTLPLGSTLPLAPPQPTAGRDRELGFISPIVTRIANEHNIDLFQVPGTGQGGRITKQDVLDFIERQSTSPITAPTTAAGKTTAPASAPLFPPGDEILPMTPVRRAIAEHMVHSERTSPHVTTVMEADLSRVIAHRQANKAAFERDGINLTFTAYFVAAAVAALKAHPIANSSWSEQGVAIHRQINIGVAASLGEEGLIVPVIKNADGLSLLGIARAVNDLAQRARAHKLSPDEVKGGTFTITNHGTSGSLFATPIINQPQCAILGVGIIQKRVVVVQDVSGADAIAIRPMVYLSLTFDHRILDGAIADAFLGIVVQSLQNWP